MMLPGALTIVTPILIGFIMGAEALGAYMAGVAVSGVLWAIFQNNAGGAWDNAKKSFEAGVEINGEMTYKGSEAHKAAVTGDTVGDPFKDTSGPSMNILIKLTCLVGLVIAPILGGHASADSELAAEGTTTETTETVYAEAVDADGNFIYDLGNPVDIQRPSGTNISVGENSSEFKLFQFFSNPDALTKVSNDPKAQWTTLDRVHFKTGSSELLPGSVEQLKNIALLMKEFPNAKVKIGGYTDNTGDEEVNLKVSTERSNIVKSGLIRLGVDEGRMQSEGYGAQHFVCEANDTDICKAKNRRVDIKVVSN